MVLSANLFKDGQLKAPWDNGDVHGAVVTKKSGKSDNQSESVSWSREISHHLILLYEARVLADVCCQALKAKNVNFVKCK